MRDKHIKIISPCYILINTLAIYGCSTSTVSNATTPVQSISSSSTSANIISNNSQPKDLPNKPDPDSVKLAGSKKPGKLIFSKNKAISCRISKWSSYKLQGTSVDLEFTNLKNSKVFNVVYTLAAKDIDGGVVRLFNEYTDKQTNITSFDQPLRKGQKRTINFGRKYIPSYSVELKGCHAAEQNEDFWTINPEMKDYQGP
jgi:hypothetical protein